MKEYVYDSAYTTSFFTKDEKFLEELDISKLRANLDYILNGTQDNKNFNIQDINVDAVNLKVTVDVVVRNLDLFIDSVEVLFNNRTPIETSAIYIVDVVSFIEPDIKPIICVRVYSKG